MKQKPGTAAMEIRFRRKLVTLFRFIFLFCSYLNERSKKSTDTGFEICFFCLEISAEGQGKTLLQSCSNCSDRHDFNGFYVSF